MDQLTIELADLKISKEICSVWGTIYVQLGDVCFPINDWGDCVSGIVDMWAHQLRAYFLGDCKSNISLHFMDGDFTIVIGAADEGIALARFYKGRSVVFEQRTDIVIFAKQFIQVTNAFCRAIHEEKTKKYNDLEKRLHKNLTLLKSQMRNYSTANRN